MKSRSISSPTRKDFLRINELGRGAGSSDELELGQKKGEKQRVLETRGLCGPSIANDTYVLASIRTRQSAVSSPHRYRVSFRRSSMGSYGAKPRALPRERAWPYVDKREQFADIKLSLGCEAAHMYPGKKDKPRGVWRNVACRPDLPQSIGGTVWAITRDRGTSGTTQLENGTTYA
ncbi:hypothetical protein KM043_013434 [Ampulex compressa]|nr:hypothetical protein KM043_013434 [Ampulex compressa]